MIRYHSSHASAGDPKQGVGPNDAAANGREAPDLPLSGRTILIVEDESLVAMLIESALEESGADVIGPCYSLAECLRTVRTERFDAAILDVDLAGEEIFPAAEELRARGIPFVFHTAHGHRTTLRDRFGDVEVCRKPMPVEDLVGAVARLTDGASTQ